MRYIDKVILHCSATPEGESFDAADIRDWHVNGNKWSDIGYHYVILLDGTIEDGRPLEIKGAHVRNENRYSIGVCYIGGCDLDGDPKDTMTYAQESAFKSLMEDLRIRFDDRLPIYGHNEFANKACPSFDVHEKFGVEFTQP